jgi:hypothetical protein
MSAGRFWSPRFWQAWSCNSFALPASATRASGVSANRIAKTYIENVFIWNAWPILYGGFGALLSAVQMGQVGQMLNQNNFLGGLGNLEGSFLIGAASIIYSLAIAIIPFIAKRIVSGDVGSTAAAMIGTAVTALTVGAAAVEGVAAGVAGSGASTGSSAGGSSASATAGSARFATTSAGTNQPTPPQQSPRTGSSATSQPASSFSTYGSEPTAEAHAEQIRGFLSEAMEADSSGDNSNMSASQISAESSDATSASPFSAGARPGGGARPVSMAKKGPSVHRYNLGTWGTYYVARVAARSLAGAVRGTSDQE